MGDNEITLCYHGKQPPTGNFSSYGLGRLMGDGVLWRHNLKVAINQLASWDGPTIQLAFKAMNLIEDMYELIPTLMSNCEKLNVKILVRVLSRREKNDNINKSRMPLLW